jgi:8-oxo-dGTP diphosphatase
MKDYKDKTPIKAAGGIVLRGGERKPQVAVVQLRKMSAWVLPKGKLADGEDMLAAARREVLEETGHRVSVHEFLGTLAYETGGRPKVVQFWRMQALGGPVGELMRDVRSMEWLALDEAIARLTHAREQAFLEHVGPTALKAAERSTRRSAASRKRVAERGRVVPATEPAVPPQWLAPVDLAPPAPVDLAPPAPVELAPPAPVIATPIEPVIAAPIEPGLPAMYPYMPPAYGDDAAAADAHSILERTWDWVRQVTQPQRPRRA